jgi:2-amino-4-hydroxy-6-hydroxymethyldihydropteridine diphosphokinase
MSDERGIDLIAGPAYVSIGSNMGRREELVLSVPRLVEASGAGRLTRMSSLYETAPVGCVPMESFINAVVEFESLLCPGDLLKRLQAIEQAAGRTGAHNEPRELDLDIITIGDVVIETESLVVPHPRYRERAFVLIPLLEVAPGFVCPITGVEIRRLVSPPPPGRVIRVSSRKTVFA